MDSQDIPPQNSSERTISNVVSKVNVEGSSASTSASFDPIYAPVNRDNNEETGTTSMRMPNYFLPM